MKRKIILNTILVLLMLSFLTFSFQSVAAQSWTTQTPIPTARGQASVVLAPDGLIYVIGGFNASDKEVKTVEAYNPTTNLWTMRAPLLLATRGAAATVGLDGLIYVFGGYNSSGPVSATQIYNPLLNTWSYGAGMPIFQWGAGAATAPNGMIYVIGGEDGPNATQIYDPSMNTWTSGAPMPNGRLEHVVVLGPDGLIYAIGGMNSSDALILDIDAYNPNTDTWITRAPLPSGRCWMGVTTGLSTSYVLGGGNGTDYIDVNEKAAGLYPTMIYVFGGGTEYSNNDPPVYGQTYAYDPQTDVWSIGTAMPTARREQGAITQFLMINTTLTIQSSASSVVAGSNVTLSGSLSPKDIGLVEIFRSINSGAFVSIGTAALSNGTYSFQTLLSDAGTYQFKAYWPGDYNYNASTSGTITVSATAQSRCIIATATYGSELAPQVQALRDFRENIALKTFAGSSFMTAFNAWYYSWSPPVAATIAPDNVARATMRVVLQPILNILEIATVTFNSLSFNGEFAIIMAGFVAASLIGLVYLMPITTVALVAINKLSKYKSLPRLSQLRILAVPWIASIILMLLGELTALPALMMLATSAFVITTILLVVGATSLKIAKTLVKL